MIRRSRASLRRDADHVFVPSVARVTPVTCQVCGYDGFCTYLGLGERQWFHGNMSQIVISHPDATIVLDGGHRRHYPHPHAEGLTLCRRSWVGRGRSLRLSDGCRGMVCLRCLQELNKTRERPIPRPEFTWVP